MNDIKNIIFDLGGVVIDLDRLSAVAAYRELGYTGAAEALGEYGQKWPFLPLEEGKFTAAEFFDTLRPMCRPGVSDIQIQDYFDGIVTSFEEGMCKPEPELFRIVTRRYGLEPGNTIMLDDSEANCGGARAAGLHAVRIDNQGADSMLSVTSFLLENPPLR